MSTLEAEPYTPVIPVEERIDILKKMKDLLASPDSWVQGIYKEEKYDKYRYCLMGAAFEAVGFYLWAEETAEEFENFSMYGKSVKEGFDIAMELSIQRLAESKGHGGVVEFNDNPNTEHGNIVDFLDERISQLEAE